MNDYSILDNPPSVNKLRIPFQNQRILLCETITENFLTINNLYDFEDKRYKFKYLLPLLHRLAAELSQFKTCNENFHLNEVYLNLIDKYEKNDSDVFSEEESREIFSINKKCFNEFQQSIEPKS